MSAISSHDFPGNVYYSLLAPDTLLPEQSVFFQDRPLQSEQRLMLAILEDAIHCFQTFLFASKPSQHTLFQEAEKWIRSKERQWLFSFENVCEILGVHAGCLRTGLAQWKAEQVRLHTEPGQKERDDFSSR